MADLLIQQASRALSSEEFRQLSEVQAELEWFANISSEKTLKAYQNDIRYFAQFVGIEKPEYFLALRH